VKDFGWGWRSEFNLLNNKYKSDSNLELPLAIYINLKLEDDRESIRWHNIFKHLRETILSYFDDGNTDGFTEGCLF